MNKQKSFFPAIRQLLAGMLVIFIPLSGINILSSCKSNKASAKNNNKEQNQTQMPKSLQHGINAFGFSMYQALEKENDNIIFSPFSISSALAMTFAGAKGETARQMQNVLGYPDMGEKTHADFNSLIKSLESQQKGSLLTVANSLWAQKDYAFLKSYFELIEKSYGGGLQLVDYVNKREEARQSINKWVELKTQDKIKELIKPRILTEDTRLVLVNAIYFLGEWQSVFNKMYTHSAPFTLKSGKDVDTDFMANTSRFGYFEDKQVQVVELPYVDRVKSMFVVLPKPEFAFESFEKSLTVDQMEKWTVVEDRKVEVFLPSFTVNTQVNLEQILMKMGMTLPFSNKADFSGMTGDTDLKIDKVIHQAFVDVSEAGTEAAAATAVVMVRKTSVDVDEKVTFKANRPFFFFIRDNASGVVLFAGRVMNPTIK